MENTARSGRNVNPLETAEKNANISSVQSDKISEEITVKKSSAVSGSNGNRSSNSAAPAENLPYDVIFSFMASLDKTELKGMDAFDEAIRTCSNGKFNSAQEVVDQLISDCESTGGDSDTFLRDFCGIIMDNSDTGAITGYDAGYGAVKTASSVIPETGTRDTTFTDNEFTIKSFTFKLEKDFSELNDDEKFIWQSLYTYWAESSLNLIEESYGYSFEDDDVTVASITLKFIKTVGGGTLADTGWWDNDGDGTIDEMDMIINTAYYGNFAEDDQDGVSTSKQEHLDRTFAHELTHAIMNAKINFRYELPMFITEGMAEITHGIDDVRTSDIRKLAADPELLAKSLDFDANYHTLAGITAPDYSGGYIFLRYLAWQVADIENIGLNINNQTARSVVEGSRFADSITNSGASSTVYANDFDDNVFNSAANAVIYGGNGNDTLTNSGNDASVFAGSGADIIINRAAGFYLDAGAGADSITNSAAGSTINAGTGDDTIQNTAHGNVFVYNAGDGNDFISGFGEDDTLDIQSGAFLINIVESDALVSLTTGEIITLHNAAEFELNITGKFLGDVTLSSDGENYRNTVANATISGSGSGNDTVVNTADNVLILANDGADSIYNTGANPSIDGGNGNDTIWNFGTAPLIDAGGDSNYIYNSSVGADATITSGSGDDTIHNNGASEVSISAGDGNNSVYIDAAASNVTVDFGSGSDMLRVNGSSFISVKASAGDNTFYFDTNSANVTVNSGAGNDSVNNWAPNSFISAGDGINTIGNSSSASNTTITAGSGNDTVSNTASSVSVDAGDGDNYLYSTDASSDVSMTAGSGNDTINNFAAASRIDAGDGDNRIFNRNTSASATINSGAGNDAMNNWAVGLYFDAGEGDNNIVNDAAASNTTITAAGNNVISNSAAVVFVNTSDGDDNISNSVSAANATINAGNGKNVVTNLAPNAFISAGDGDDSVYSASGENSTINVGGGSNTINNNASAAVMFAGSGSDYFYNTANASNITISAGDGDNSINNNASSLLAYFGSGNDYIYNAAPDVTLYAGSGDNTLLSSAPNIIIRAEEGNDFLRSTGANSSLRAGDGADTVYAYGGNSTISAGGDDDLIALNSSGGNVIRFSAGTDYIYGISESDSILVEDSNYELLDTNEGHAVVSIAGGMLVIIGGMSVDFNIAAVNPADDGEAPLPPEAPESPAVSPQPTVPPEPTDTGVISLTSGGDSYSNDNDNVTIHALAGNDTVENSGNGVVIFGEEGNDQIFSYGNRATLSGGKGNDTIYSEGTGALFEYASGDGNDIIYGITANDTLTVTGSFTYSTDGDNAIVKVGSSAITLDGAAQREVNINGEIYKAEEDTIPPEPTDTGVVSLTSGNDSYSNDNDNVTIHALAGNDTVENSGKGVVIFGEEGNDQIFNYGNDATLSGGKGNDTIYSENTGALFEYASGDGNDIIYGITANDTLTVTGSFTYSTDGDNAIVKIGNGAITLDGAAELEININGETYKTEPEDTDTLPAGISISGSVMTLTKDFAGDSVAADEFESAVTAVDASKLSRGISIVGTAEANSLKGGTGADTISGLKGNDTLTGGSGADIFVYSAGNDFITDYAVAQDKISISGAISSESLSGSNVVLKIGTGSLTIANAKDKNITIIDKAGNETSRVYPEVTEPADTLPAGLTYNSATKVLTVDSAYTATALDVAKLSAESAAKTVDASALTAAIKISGTKNAMAITGGKGNDTLAGGAGNDTLTGNAGADIFIYTGGSDIIKDYTASQKDVISLVSGSVTSASLSGSNEIFKIGSNSITVTGGKNQEISIGSAIYYNNLVYDSKKTSATIGSAQKGTLKAADYATGVKVIDATNLSKAAVIGNAQANTITGGKGADSLWGGAGNDVINGGAANDKLYGDAGNDKLNGDAGNDTLNGGAGNDTLTGGAGADVFIYDGGNDVIADYSAKDKDTVSIGSAKVTGATLKSSDLAIKIGSGAVTVKGAKNQEVTIGSSIYYNNLIYDTKKTSATIGSAQKGTLKAADYDSKIKALDASNLSKAAVIGNGQANTITGGKGADSLWGGAGNDVINGGAANDKIYGDAGNDKLNGDAGNDTLYGGAGNDTFTGGAGADVFVYEGGKDVITDYSAKDKDEIDIGSAKVTGATLKGSDLSLKIGSGTLTVKGVKTQEVSIGSTIYFGDMSYDSKKTAVTLGSAFSGKFEANTIGKKVATIDGSAAAKAINVVGNDAANAITGGKGADTLAGGKGNDTLTGGDGKDVFVYSAGKDVITDYAAGKDTIRIDGEITKTSYSGKDVVFTIDGDSKKTLTVKNGNGSKLTIALGSAKATTELYSSSNGNAAVPWYAEDDTNFIGGGAQIDDICAENYSVTQVETASDFENLAQAETLVAYTDK